MQTLRAQAMAAVILMFLGPWAGAQQTQRQIVLRAMQQRPADPWPRGSGHVLLSVPGSAVAEKGYHEPGGSFSPGIESFGVSIWVVEASSNLLATSDQIPLDKITQQWLWPTGAVLPVLETGSPYYRATWAATEPGQWRLRLQAQAPAKAQVVLAIRSVGPTGGAVHALEWQGGQLRVNRRWTVDCRPLPRAVQLGSEGETGWKTARSRDTRSSSPEGWAFARLELSATGEWEVVIQDPMARPSPLRVSRARPPIILNVPDPQFIDCFEAQVAQLTMGLAGLETRPADPLIYLEPEPRPAALILTALAEVGLGEVACQIAQPLAEVDFFGRNRPEADNPGLALWALSELSARVREAGFDRWLYPHLLRKSRLLAEFRQATQPVHIPLPRVLPRAGMNSAADLSRVCDPARGGLIIGKVAGQRPVLYVNAVSYAGWLGAAEVAERLGFQAEAAAWRSQASALRLGWNRAFATSEAINDRDYLFSLWPAGVVSDHARYRRHLETRWGQTHDDQDQPRMPMQPPGFLLAEVRQWLEFEQADRIWSTLHWFWNHQASPGLYTWDEPVESVVPPDAIEDVRGWVSPAQVTPLYDAAATLVLLQLDMLVRVEETANGPGLVIGSGIPSAWLAGPMRVQGIWTRLGRVDWTWGKLGMDVVVSGRRCPVRLGPVFPPNTPLYVQ